jgi:RHS repeat-associated protein
LQDEQGTVRDVVTTTTSPTAGVNQHVQYDSFGNVVSPSTALASIAIQNAGFEESLGAPAHWTPSVTGGATASVVDPGSGANDDPNNTPEGNRALRLGVGVVYSYEPPKLARIGQTTPQAIGANTTYELRVKVHPVGVDYYGLELRAVDTTQNPPVETLLASREYVGAGINLDAGEWRDHVLRWASGPSPANTGQQLKLVLVGRGVPPPPDRADDDGAGEGGVKPPPGGIAAGYVWFDDVRLTKRATLPRNLYTGREFDGETGQYNYRARYYDPQAGRFLNTDPAENDADNLYRYVGNNAPNLTDPSGMGAMLNSGHSAGGTRVSGGTWGLSDLISGAKSLFIDPLMNVFGRIGDSGAAAYARWNTLDEGTRGLYKGADHYAAAQVAASLPASAVGWWSDHVIEPTIQSSSEGAAIRTANAASYADWAKWNTGFLGGLRAIGSVALGAGSGALHGAINDVVGVYRTGKELALGAVDIGNSIADLSGHRWYHGNLSVLGSASMHDDFSISRNAAETGANLATFGVYGEGKLTYQYATGQIDSETYSAAMGTSGLFQVGGALALRSSSSVRTNAASSPVTWVDETAGMSTQARLYNSGAQGARSNLLTRQPQAPSIRGPSGIVRFDGESPGLLIDRKLAVVMSSKAQSQALRQSAALRQNGLRGMWEVPDVAQAARARNLFNSLGIDNIDVRVVPQ